MLTGDTLVFAVRSLMRLGVAAQAAYEQSVRDAPIRLDNLPSPQVDNDAALWAFFFSVQRRERVQPGGDLAHLWQERKPVSEEARATLQAERLRILSEDAAPGHLSWTEARLAREAPAKALIEQWAPGEEPPPPAARIALALADVALDFTAANPGVLGVGGNGEKLLGALASTMRELLPDVDDKKDWGRRPAHYQFAERTLAILFRAGLHVVSEKADLIVSEEHYQNLLRSLTKPLLDMFDENALDRPSLSNMRDRLLGPMARAALTALQENPRAFVGRRFDPNEAVGAIAAAVLHASAKGAVTDVFTPEGLLKLYQAALQVAVARPALFVKGEGPQPEAVRDVLVAIAGVLRKAPPPFAGALGADVAVAAIEALKGNVPGLLRLGEGWKSLAAEMIDDVLGGLAQGIELHPDASLFETLFTTEEALQLAQTLMSEVARTPGMLGTQAARDEVRLLAAALSSVLAHKGSELLRAQDWITIARAVALEAARNPLRLVAKQGNAGVADQLLAKLLGTLLQAAARGFGERGRTAAALLFGDTLREAIILAVRAAASRAEKALAHIGALADFVERLEGLARKEQRPIGAADWLFLFERHVVQVLETGSTDKLGFERLQAELEAQ